jgi:hypothetical protein
MIKVLNARIRRWKTLIIFYFRQKHVIEEETLINIEDGENSGEIY